MSSIKTHDSSGQRWVVRGSSSASEINVIDAENNFINKNVEGALRELAEKSKTINSEEIQELRDDLDSLEYKFNDHIANHPGGSGGIGSLPTITSSYTGGNLQQGEALSIPIYYTSPNLGDGTAYVIINGVESLIVTVNQGTNIINVGILEETKSIVQIYVKDRAGLLSNQLEWTVISGGLTLTVNFDSEVDYTIDDKIKIPFTIKCADTSNPITVHYKIDYEESDDIVKNGYNEKILTDLAVGVHTITMQAISGDYKSSTYEFNIVIVNSYDLYLSSTFKDNSEYEYGYPLNINYRVSKATAEYFTIELSIDDVVSKTLSVQAGSYYWTIPLLEIGSHKLTITATEESGKSMSITRNVNIILGDYTPIEINKSGLLAWFDATDKSNQDANKDIWIDKVNGNKAYLKDFNFTTNGWIDGQLVCNGTSYVEIDMTPYANNVKGGSTIEILYNTHNIGNDEARVIDYTDSKPPYKGFYCDLRTAKLDSMSQSTEVGLDEEKETRVTFVIDRDNKFSIIYVNGVLMSVKQLSDQGMGVNKVYEDFTHSEKMYLNSKKGVELFGACDIKQLRIYDRALDHEEILLNHLADMPIKQQRERYKFNFENSTTPEIRLYGDVSRISNTVPANVRLKYTSPNSELYGESINFSSEASEMLIQGTSSLQYVLKNFTIYLKDDNLMDYYYTPYRNGILENVYCFKAD